MLFATRLSIIEAPVRCVAFRSYGVSPLVAFFVSSHGLGKTISNVLFLIHTVKHRGLIMTPEWLQSAGNDVVGVVCFSYRRNDHLIDVTNDGLQEQLLTK